MCGWGLLKNTYSCNGSAFYINLMLYFPVFLLVANCSMSEVYIQSFSLWIFSLGIYSMNGPQYVDAEIFPPPYLPPSLPLSLPPSLSPSLPPSLPLSLSPSLPPSLPPPSLPLSKKYFNKLYCLERSSKSTYISSTYECSDNKVNTSTVHQ